MALQKIWAIDGIKNVPASVARSGLWAATSGGTGVILPTDFRVSALGTPGGAVRIGVGGAVAASRYGTPVRPESYAMTTDAGENFTIPATGSGSGRTDFIIARVDDWHRNGSTPPADLTTATGWKFDRVSSMASVSDPYVPLARVQIPASTAAITNAMITDLRQVANPRQLTVVRRNALYLTETETLTTTSANGEYWPNNGGLQQIDIPSWATYFSIRAEWHSVFKGSTQSNAVARVWVAWGPWVAAESKHQFATQPFALDFPNATGEASLNVSAVDHVYIPAAMRGQSQVPFRMMARLITSGINRPVMNANSGTSLEVTFQEAADDVSDS